MDFLTQVALIELTALFISTPYDSEELAMAICEIMPRESVSYNPFTNIIYFAGTGMPFAVGP
jgi:hypothetical protein